MRISRLCALAVAATLLLAPAAGAFTHGRVNRSPAPQALYYSSYGTPTPIPRAQPSHGDSPWVAIGLAVGVTLVAGGAVAFAVRSRGRRLRVRVS